MSFCVFAACLLPLRNVLATVKLPHLLTFLSESLMYAHKEE